VYFVAETEHTQLKPEENAFAILREVSKERSYTLLCEANTI
jgi:hypothetical protein